MKRILFLILIILTGFITNFSQLKPENIAGVYRNCQSSCELITIGEDFSFEYFRYGNSYGIFYRYDGLEGKWNLISDKQIYIEGSNEKSINELKKIEETSEVKFDPVELKRFNKTFILEKKEICSLSENGDTPICYEKLSKKKVNNLYSQIKTKEISGVYQWCSVHCEVVKINEDFTVEYMFYRYFDSERLSYKGILTGNWEIVGDNKLRIIGVDNRLKESLEKAYEEDGISIDPIYPPEIDFTFIIGKNKLQKLFNGSVEYTLKKLNKKEADKLFPEN